MDNIAQKIKPLIKGDIANDEETLALYSKDASIFSLRPRVVVFPKDAEDVKAVVRFVNEESSKDPSLYITARAAGTDMSGGAIGESIILDFTRYMNKLKKLEGDVAVVEPGMYYRDFEKETLQRGLVLPSYTASKSINAVGGMVGNNSGGELSLQYGQTQRYTAELKVVLADGNEHTLRALSAKELEEKVSQQNFEGELYRMMQGLLSRNYEIIQKARPNVSKNASGYYLWNAWDKESFDLTQVIVGSQGTLGIVTEITFRLIPVFAHTQLLVVFMDDLSKLSEVVSALLRFQPKSLESYDNNTLKIALKYFPEIVRQMGPKNIFTLGLSLLPDVWILLKSLLRGKGLPDLIILAEFASESEQELKDKAAEARSVLKALGVTSRLARSKEDAEKYWTIRRQSFSLLRKHIRGKRTAPFIDDFIVRPEKMGQFLPRLNAILREYPSLVYTIAGHAGNGNFHIIPLMDLKDKAVRKIIPELSAKVYDLVLEFQGSITAEHNDGLIRSSYIKKMYGEEVYGLFEETKRIFDPRNIFNRGKKVGASMEYAMKHIDLS